MKQVARFASLLSIVLHVSGCDAVMAPAAAPETSTASATAPATFMAPPASGPWSMIELMADTRYATAAAGADGRIFAFSGLRRAVLTDAEVYDPAVNTWHFIASPGAQGAAGAALGADGRIYLVGGLDASFAPLNTVQAYDPAGDFWLPAGSLNTVRYNHGVVAGADGRIYALGGTSDGLDAIASVEVSNAGVTQWTAIAPMQLERQAFAAAADRNGRIYAFGGMTNADITATSEVYDPANGTWSPVTSMPAPRFGHSAARGADGLIYVMGGRWDGYKTTVFAYDPAEDSWSEAPPMQVARYLPGAAAGSDGYIYAIGGKPSSTIIHASSERLLTQASNQAPVASAGADQDVECAAGCASVTLDATASSDPDDDPLTYEWLVNGEVIASGIIAVVQLDLGSHHISLRVTDDEGATTNDDLVVNVRDTQGPVIAFRQIVSELRPVNHKLVLAASISASDACEGSPALRVSVTSSEPSNAQGDGSTDSDWQITRTADGVQVWLRAERTGGGGGRVYTISATARDVSGNEASAGGTVTVPRDDLDALRDGKKLR